MSSLLLKQYEQLKSELKASASASSVGFNQQHSTRLHRALSWLKAASEQMDNDNTDQAFINLWISFSACFYIDGDAPVESFIEKIVALDKQQKIYECLWHQYSGSVKALIKNPYVFDGFWQAQRNQLQGSHSLAVTDSLKQTMDEPFWMANFEQSSVEALNYLSRKKVAPLFSIVLDRLYVLRNQVLQGGATYQSRVNREQVSDGVNLLASIMPVIISIMLAGADQDWGEIAYPVISS